MGRTEIPDLRGLQGEPWLVGTVFFQLERSGALLKADTEVRSKKNLTPPTLSERRCYASWMTCLDKLQKTTGQ